MYAVILAVLTIASPAAAQVKVVPDQPSSAASAREGVDVYLINDSDAAVSGDAPGRIEVTAADTSRIILVPVGSAPATIAARAFARVRYRAEVAPPHGSRGDGMPPLPDTIAAVARCR